MSRRWRAAAAAAAAAAVMASLSGAAQAQDSPAREPTDIHIRRLAGLPPESARGAMEILDVGHHAMETMVSIVARRAGGGWSVSYACAESPACASGADHVARTYMLSSAAAIEVDALLATLRRGSEPDDNSRPDLIGGWLRVAIDDRGFRHRYFRVMTWGPVLGRLEELLKPPA